MERLAYLPQVRLVFGEQSPQSAGRNGNFVHPVRRYAALLLTMIKIVLIATISFAPLCQ